jgi:hypothetical protein
MQYSHSSYFEAVAVAEGDEKIIELAGEGPATIAVFPAAGASATLYFSVSSRSAIAAGQGLFAPASGLGTGGLVSSAKIDIIPHKITAIKVVGTAGSSVVEVRE